MASVRRNATPREAPTPIVAVLTRGVASEAVELVGQFPWDTEDKVVDVGADCDICTVLDTEEGEEEEEAEEEAEEEGSMSCPSASAFADPQQSVEPSVLQHHRPPEEALQGCTTDDCGEPKAIPHQHYVLCIIRLFI